LLADIAVYPFDELLDSYYRAHVSVARDQIVRFRRFNIPYLQDKPQPTTSWSEIPPVLRRLRTARVQRALRSGSYEASFAQALRNALSNRSIFRLKRQ